MFCPSTGKMKRKSGNQIEQEISMSEDEIVMIEIRKIGDSLIPMLKTEADNPGHGLLGGKHPNSCPRAG